MGIWDKVKQTVSDLWNKAVKAVAWVRDKVSDAVVVAKDWWNDAVTPGAQQLASAAEQALTQGSKAISNSAQSVWDANQRLFQAMNQRSDEIREDLVRRAAAEQKQAAARLNRAIEQTAQAADLINEKKEWVKQAAAEYAEKAKQELEQARQIPEAAEDVLEELNRRALEELMERKDMITGLSQKTQDFMNEIAAEVNPRMKTVFSSKYFRVKITPEERRRLEDPDTAFTIALAGLNIGPGVNKLLGRAPSAAGRAAAARIRMLMSKKGLKTFVDNFRKNPKVFLKNIEKMKTPDRAKFLNALRKAPGGEALSQSISNTAVKEWTTTLGAATRNKWLKLIPRSPKTWLMLVGTLMAVYGAEFTAIWFKKETPEMSLTSYEDAVRARDWKSVLRQYPFQRALQDELRDNWLSRLLETLPPFGRWSILTWQSQDAALEEGLTRAMEAVAKGEVFMGTLHVIVSPDDAVVQVNNKFMGKGTLRNLDVAPGAATIMVYRTGYISKTETVRIKPEEATTVNISLQLAPTKQYAKWEKTTPTQRKTLETYNPKAYTYWTKAPEANKQYYQDNYLSDRRTWAKEQQEYWAAFEAEQEDTGTLLIMSTPKADIYIGGIDTGKTTPAAFILGPGTYDISLDTPKYEIWTGKAFIKAGETVEIQAELKSREPTERELTRGYVSVVTDPLGAWVFIDGVVADYPTPTKLELEPGMYEFKIVKTGYQELVFPVDVDAGETIRIEETLEPEEKDKVWRVFVNSTPPGGKILVDGFFSGSWTDGYVDLLAGTYTISVQKTGFKEASQTVEVGL